MNAKERNTESVSISLSKDLLMWIDEKRGRINRSAYVNDLLEAVKTGIESGSLEV